MALQSRSDRLDQVLGGLLAQTPEIEAAAVVSFDGLPMASALPPSMDEDRVAAMSAALLSLGERAAQGLGRGELSQVYIEGDSGTVFLISADDEAVLVAVAARGAKAGMMLFEVKRAAAAVAGVLRADDLPVVPEQVAAGAPQSYDSPLAAYAALQSYEPAPAAWSETPVAYAPTASAPAGHDDLGRYDAPAAPEPVYAPSALDVPAEPLHHAAPATYLPTGEAWTTSYAPTASAGTVLPPAWS